MTRQQSFRQANAFAMLDGLWFGLYCCFGFLCVIKGMGSSTLGSLGTMVTLSVPVLGCFFARKFERQVRDDAPVGYGKAYLYSILLYFYASLILAIFAFVYFNWFDHGVFAQNYIVALNSPEVREVMEQGNFNLMLGSASSQSGLETVEELVRSVTPVDMAAGLFNMNILIGLLLALPTAAFGCTRKRKLF